MLNASRTDLRKALEAGRELIWDGADQSYATKLHRPSYLSTISTLHRMGTASLEGETAAPDIEDAWVLEERIQTAVSRHRFLILSVAPKHLLKAERELLQRFPLQRISIEALLIGQMKALAEEAGASWDVVLRADSAERGSKDWRNLVTLVRRARCGARIAPIGKSSVARLFRITRPLRTTRYARQAEGRE